MKQEHEIRAQGLSLFDRVLLEDRDIFHWSDTQRESFLLQYTKEAMQRAIDHGTIFSKLCANRQITPTDIMEMDDLQRIPLLPSSIFKHHILSTAPESSITKYCTSSGTQGTVSIIPRNDQTLQRFIGSTFHLFDLLVGLPDRAMIFNLGPSPQDAGNLWFAYVMSSMGLLYPSKHYVIQHEFKMTKLLDDLNHLEPELPALVIGPPALFEALMKIARDQRLDVQTGDRELCIITAGGWKKHTDKEINRVELDNAIADFFHLSNTKRVRDIYSMVELNTPLIEDEGHHMLVPPWLYVSARDPATLKPVPDGEMGLLAWIDTSATSYPAFILSDDFGTVSDVIGPTGSRNRSVSILRRVNKVESRGCALKIDSAIDYNSTGSGKEDNGTATE